MDDSKATLVGVVVGVGVVAVITILGSKFLAIDGLVGILVRIANFTGSTYLIAGAVGYGVYKFLTIQKVNLETKKRMYMKNSKATTVGEVVGVGVIGVVAVVTVLGINFLAIDSLVGILTRIANFTGWISLIAGAVGYGVYKFLTKQKVNLETKKRMYMKNKKMVVAVAGAATMLIIGVVLITLTGGVPIGHLIGRGSLVIDGLSNNSKTLVNNKKSNVKLDSAKHKEAIKINSKDAEAYYNRGNTKSLLKQYQGAILDFNQVIDINPKDAEAYNNRGIAQSALGNNKEAILNFNQVIDINPKDAEAYYNRGNEKLFLTQYQEAILDFSRAIAINSKFAQAYVNRGNAQAVLGNNKEAILDFSRAIAINPKFAQVYFNQGNAQAVLGNNKEAILNYNKAININPRYAEAYFNRGIAQTALGNNKEAILNYNKVLDINPRYAEAYVNQGIAKLALGDKDKAILDFKKAKKIFLQQKNTTALAITNKILHKLK